MSTIYTIYTYDVLGDKDPIWNKNIISSKKLLDPFRMISIDAWRSSIGKWSRRSLPVKQSSSSEAYKIPRGSLNQSMSSSRKITRIMRAYWEGLLLLLLMEFYVLHPPPNTTLDFHFGTGTSASPMDEMLQTPLPTKLIQLMLVIGGVEQNPGPVLVCEYCGDKFKRGWNMRRHIERQHLSITNILCHYCKKVLNNVEELRTHMLTMHKPRTERWQVTNSAFKKSVVELTYFYNENRLEKAFSESVQRSVHNQIVWYRRLFGSLKFSLSFTALMRKSAGGEEIIDSFFFQGLVQRLQSGELDIEEKVKESFRVLRDRVLDLDVPTVGSGWSFFEAQALTINVVKMGAKKMGSYIPFKPRNDNFNALKSPASHIINVRNTKNHKCAIYNIILAKFGHLVETGKDDPRNLEPFMKHVNVENVEFPILEKDLQQLEENNASSLNISINVWKYIDNKLITPFFISRVRRKGKTAVNMLLIEKREQDQEITQHLVYIKDVASLFRESRPGGQKARHGLICSVCQDFATSSFEKLNRHFKQCSDPNYFKKTYPKAVDEYTPEGRLLPPPNSYRSAAPWLRGFFDFECLHQKKESIGCGKCHQTMKTIRVGKQHEVVCPHSAEKKTTTIADLPAFSYSFLMIDSSDKIIYERC